MAENITYGFWRNTFACRVPAVVVCVVSPGAAPVLGPLTGPQVTGLLIFDTVAVIFWFVGCRPETVRRAAQAYSDQLFAPLESLHL